MVPHRLSRPILLGLLTFLAAFMTVAPIVSARSASYTSASLEYGMGVFVWGRPDAADTLGRVRDMQFSWQKSLISWRDVEGAGKGQFDWSNSDALVQ